MSGFIQGEDRFQATLFPERIDDYVAEDSAVRVIDVFIDELDLSGMGFRTQPNETGRPAYHPTTMLKLFVYGYLNRVHSSRRLEREAQRNRRADVADRKAGAGLQDYRRLPQGQWGAHSPGLSPVRHSVS